MPVISMFYGIVVLMYSFDGRRHRRPHVHARFQGEEAVIAIPDGEVLEGSLPGPKLKLVVAWVELHREELVADWDLATLGEPLFRIEPLR